QRRLLRRGHDHHGSGSLAARPALGARRCPARRPLVRDSQPRLPRQDQRHRGARRPPPRPRRACHRHGRGGAVRRRYPGRRPGREGLKRAELSAEQVDTVIVTGLHARAARSLSGRLGATKDALADDLSATVGNTGAAHSALLLTRVLESATPGQVIALVVLADGADVLLFRATKAISSWRPARTVDAQVKAGTEVPYGKFLAWRGMLPVEPPRRPEP